ncbi:hypothetical protein [Streptosporangium sp. NBC_01756]|uniref:hypothetical protein n=1 Tax=Streptosporangium sp. NBC_01756 TaxID=2975950 RepID=UPI002DDC5E52|nr:hypothetical protein [Streptosporangium sp. NBC_01756]WSC88360.1 hypothetical protein OIE48_09295 [Streptosporangium sp. NBC_01756]
MRLISLLLSAALLTTPGAVADAGARSTTPGTVTDFGVQSTALTLYEGFFGTGEGDRPVVYTAQMGTPGVVATIDPVTREHLGTAELPGASGGWGITQADDGAVYAGSYPNAHLYRVGSGPGSDLGAPVAGETVLYGLQPGRNGKVYGGTYPGAHAFSYSPTEGLRDLGAMYGGEQYVIDVAVDPDREVLWAAVGTGGHLIRMDLRTGDKRDIWPEALRGDPNHPYDINLVAGKLFVKRAKLQALVLDPDTGAVLADGFTITSRGTTRAAVGGYVYFTSGTALWRYDLAADRPEPVPGSVATGGPGVGWGFVDGRLYGLIGNYYGDAFSYDPATGASERFKLPLPAQPIDINNVSAGQDGKIYTNLYINGNVATLDPATGKATELGRVAQTDGWFWREGKMYLGTYPYGAVLVYDPAQPFKTGTNPRELFRLIDDGQNRPQAFATAHGKLYIGSTPDYGLWGGALTAYDVATGEHTVLRAPVADQGVVSLLALGGTLWGGTTVNGGGGTTPKAAEARLFTYAPDTGTKTAELTPVPGASSITSLVEGPDGLIWGLADGTLFILDPATSRVLQRIALPAGYGGVQDELHVNPDEHVYASLDGLLLRVDPLSKTVTVVRADGTYRTSQDGQGNLWFRSGVKAANGAVQDGSHLLRYSPAPDACPRSDLSATVIVKGNDSGVPNRYRPDGCTIEDVIEDEKYSGAELVVRVAKATARLVASRTITPAEAAKIIKAVPKPR